MKQGISKQATSMVSPEASSSSDLHPRLNDCVTITIPRPDRPKKMGIKNFVGIIVNIQERNGHLLYDIATKYGCIRPLVSRNQFVISRRKNIIDIDTVDKDRTVSIRKIAAAEAIVNKEETQVTTFCNCATDYCRTMRCFCRRSGVLCTPNCKHGRDPKTGRINHEIAVNFNCRNK